MWTNTNIYKKIEHCLIFLRETFYITIFYVWIFYDWNNNNDRLTAFDPGQPG